MTLENKFDSFDEVKRQHGEQVASAYCAWNERLQENIAYLTQEVNQNDLQLSPAQVVCTIGSIQSSELTYLNALLDASIPLSEDAAAKVLTYIDPHVVLDPYFAKEHTEDVLAAIDSVRHVAQQIARFQREDLDKDLYLGVVGLVRAQISTVLSQDGQAVLRDASGLLAMLYTPTLMGNERADEILESVRKEKLTQLVEEYSQ